MDDVALCCHVFGASRLSGPHCDEAFNRCSVRAAANPQFITAIPDVLGHAVAHETEADKSDNGLLFHFNSFSIVQDLAA